MQRLRLDSRGTSRGHPVPQGHEDLDRLRAVFGGVAEPTRVHQRGGEAPLDLRTVDVRVRQRERNPQVTHRLTGRAEGQRSVGGDAQVADRAGGELGGIRVTGRRGDGVEQVLGNDRGLLDHPLAVRSITSTTARCVALRSRRDSEP